MRPGTSVKKASLIPILRRAQRGRVRLSHVARLPGPPVARAQVFARREHAQTGAVNATRREERRVRPHRLRLDAESRGRRVHDDRGEPRAVLDPQLQIGPPQNGGAPAVDAEPNATGVAPPRTGSDGPTPPDR